MEPKISIIVPIYNVENYLCKCVDSLINQSYKNLEIILVDDESPDNCGQICDEYKMRDERIIVIHQKNQGLSGARNSGLDIASGDYIAFIDSDDWVGLDMYKTMIKLALEHQLDIIECSLSESGNENNNINRDSINLEIENTIEALERILKSSQFSACTKLFKRSVIGNSRFLLNKTSEDIYFMVENIPKINKMGYYAIPFYNYRQNPESITKSPYSIRRLEDSLEASLYLERKLKPLTSNNSELEKVVMDHMLLKVFMHYKKINYNSKLDSSYKHRNYLKKLLLQYYYDCEKHDFFLKLAYQLSTKNFNRLISLNKLKHRLLNGKQIS